MNTVLAAIATFAILVPCALYWISTMRREREQPDPQQQPEPQAEQEQGEETPTFEPDPATISVEQTFTQKVTNVALTWVKQSIGAGPGDDRQAIEPPRPQPAPEPEDWTPPTDLDDLPNLEEWDVEVVRPNPDQQQPPPSIEAGGPMTELHRGQIDRVRDMLSDHTPQPRELPAPQLPPAAGEFDPFDLAAIPDPVTIPAVSLPDLPVLPVLAELDGLGGGPDIHVEHIPNPDQQLALPTPDEPSTMTATVEIIGTPVELQGVDMELVPVGRRTMARVPTIGGLRSALRTGGFTILRSWLAGFRKATSSDQGHAKYMNRLAIVHAHRCRVKLAAATNLVQAVQADKLGPNVMRGCVATWQQCHREFVAAHQMLAASEHLVRASGGVPASVKDAMRALDRDHGGMAREARKMTVEPVPDMSFYRN